MWGCKGVRYRKGRVLKCCMKTPGVRSFTGRMKLRSADMFSLYGHGAWTGTVVLVSRQVLLRDVSFSRSRTIAFSPCAPQYTVMNS